MMSKVLHILTPLSSETPASLVEGGVPDVGDVIADFRRFPFAVHELRTDQACPDITSSLFAAPDYPAVIREWLIQFTAETGLQDILAVEGHGFWWTQNSLKFRPSTSDLGNAFAWIDLMLEIERQVRPSSIIVHGQHVPLINLVGQIYQKLPLQVESEASVQTTELSRPSRRIGLLIARVLLGILYLIYSLFRRPDICFFVSSSLLRNVAIGSKQNLRDIYMGDVAEAFEARGWRMVMAETYGWNASWKGLVTRGFFFPNDILFLFSTPSWSRLGIRRSLMRKWQQKWADIQPVITPHLKYQGYDISPLALPLLAREFSHYAPYFEVMTKVWSVILRLWRPKLLYINAFYGLPVSAAIVAARSLNIPTVEQQHGVIGNNHTAYLVPRQLKPKTEFPLCDKMVVWGDYTKRLLVDTGVYEPGQVVVCGFPRIDALLDTLPPRTQTLQQLGIPPDAQVVLYTSGLVARDLRSEVLDSIDAAPDSARICWIVKLHPREKTRHKWETAITQRQIQNVKVVEGEFDFYALLAACDIHISFISTTLIEAAVLGKPNLGLAIPYVPDSVGYADAKAFLPVAPNKLGSAVRRILHDPVQREMLLREQKAFANDWCLHDGEAINRIVQFVGAMVSTQT